MSLFKKQSSIHQPDRKQVQNIQDTPKHPVLQFRRKNKNKKHDHLDNYVQIRPFADAEFSRWSFTSYSDQFDELYKLYLEKNEKNLEEARKLCGEDDHDIWKKLYDDEKNPYRRLNIVRVYKWLVETDKSIPLSKKIKFDRIVKEPEIERERRKKLGYNKENPWSEEKEMLRKKREDEYIKTYGNAPPYEFWQEYWNSWE